MGGCQINFTVSILLYYMDNGVLLGTETLVELIRHYIRDQMRAFSVFHSSSLLLF